MSPARQTPPVPTSSTAVLSMGDMFSEAEHTRNPRRIASTGAGHPGLWVRVGATATPDLRRPPRGAHSQPPPPRCVVVEMDPVAIEAAIEATALAPVSQPKDHVARGPSLRSVRRILSGSAIGICLRAPNCNSDDTHAEQNHSEPTRPCKPRDLRFHDLVSLSVPIRAPGSKRPQTGVGGAVGDLAKV